MKSDVSPLLPLMYKEQQTFYAVTGEQWNDGRT